MLPESLQERFEDLWEAYQSAINHGVSHSEILRQVLGGTPLCEVQSPEDETIP